MTPESDPASNLTGGITDDDLQQMLRRAQWTVLVLALVLFAIFTWTLGWQSGLLEVAGAVISFSGIREWRSLARAVSSTLNPQQAPHPMGRTLVMFFLRLGVVGGILYVSLRCLHGSVYALAAGIALAVVALTIEAVRLLRN